MDEQPATERSTGVNKRPYHAKMEMIMCVFINLITGFLRSNNAFISSPIGAIGFVVLISFFGCADMDGVIEYGFKGRLYSDSAVVSDVKISIDFFNAVENDSLRSSRDPMYTLTDSLGNYSVIISQGCSGTSGFLGIGGDSDCDSRVKSATMYVAIQCESSAWKVDSIYDVEILEGTTTLPDYAYESLCHGN